MHSVLSEPYYYESAYDFDFEPGVMVADSCGQCYYKDMKYVSGKLVVLGSVQKNVKNSSSLR